MGLKESLLERGISTGTLSLEAGVTKFAASHYLQGRRRKAGKLNCRKIEAYLIQCGLMKPRKKMKVIEGNEVAPWVLRRFAKEFAKACRE